MSEIKLFQDKKIRSAWNEEEEQWYFSIEDVVAALTDSADPKQYVKRMRQRDEQLHVNWGTICTQVEMLANDGKQRRISCYQNIKDTDLKANRNLQFTLFYAFKSCLLEVA